jgi:exodeoxyribonuclease VII large subunit
MNGRQLTLTVGELNEYVRRSLAGDPMLHGVRLKGELSNFKRHVSGHWYFTLKDEQSAIACAMFRSAASTVRFTPSEGGQVVLTGSVGLYVKTGSYQFYAEQMEQDGVGEMYLRLEALKAKLQKEGLFDAALKQPLPLLPRGVGIVTSGTGAVIHDIARIAWRRFAGMPLYLYPVAVQGEGAAEQIAKALSVMDRLNAVDVIIVGRGGGSMEDLWAFNDEAVARAIAACRKPVVSAVGHEADVTLSDLAADVRAATPSAAAELAVPERDALLAECLQLFDRLRRAGDAALMQKAASVNSLQRRLAEQAPEKRLATAAERAHSLWSRIDLLASGRLTGLRHAVSELTLRLNAASPQATLGRGYAMVTQRGRLVPTFAELDINAPFTVTLRDGKVAAQALPFGKEETP